MTAPIILPAGVSNSIVSSAYDKWSSVATQAFTQAQQYVGQMIDVPLTPVTFDASFNPQLALPGFPPMPPPPVPNAAMAFNAPGTPPAPPSVDSGVYNPSSAPSFDVVAPAYQPPATPQLSALPDVGQAPTLSAPVIPDAPTLSFPDVPTMNELALPDLPMLTVPEFTATMPAMNIPTPVENFSFSPEAYTDALLDQTKATISSMMSGDFVLPPGVVDAIRSRAQEAVNEEEGRAVDQAYNEIAARGFNEPNGVLNLRVRQARDGALKARSSANRDIYVQDQTVAKENLRTAVGSGIQLEGQLIQLHVSQTQLLFDSAKYALEVTLQIFQARVTLYNTQLQAYSTAAGVYRDRIMAMQAQAQAYLAEMEGVRAQTEVNQQKVSIYNAQLEGVRTMVGVYTAQVQAAEVTARANLAQVQAFTAKVQAFSASVEAQTAQWSGYKTQVDAQLGAAQFYQTSVNAFGMRTQAWATGETAKQEVVRLKLDEGKMNLSTWQAKLQQFDALLRTELARVDSVVKGYEASVDGYRAQAAMVGVAGQYDERRFQLNLAQEQAIVDTSLKRSEASFEQVKFFTTLLVEIKKALATVESQLAASAMNAVNIGATLGASESQSISWSTGIELSGSVKDV